MSTHDDRTQVLYYFNQMLQQQSSLPKNFSQWSAQAKNLLLQTCRYYPQLKAIVLHLSHKKIKHPQILATLLIALCELKILHKPAHAVIHEWINIMKSSPHRYAAGFVNALLRQFAREQAAIEQQLALHLEYQYAHPLWFIQLLQELWPQKWEHILVANNSHPPMSLRVNLHQISRAELLAQLNLPAYPGQVSPSCLILETATKPEHIAGFSQGWCSVQDEGAQLAAMLLNLQPGLRILDACAAPGGKVAHILESFKNLHCIALEPSAQRFKKLQHTLVRLQLNAQCIQADATKIDTWWDGQPFDRILIDAPCSGTGVIRRHPDFKLRPNKDALLLNTEIQQQLLDSLWPLLTTNGILLYATCSLLPQENDQQIQIFLERHTNAQLEQPHVMVGTPTTYGQQILPGQNNMDGFYYAAIKKIVQ